MYRPNVLFSTVVFLFLIDVTSSVNDASFRNQFKEIENLALVKNVYQIRNWRGLLQKSGVRYKSDCDEIFQEGEHESGLYIIEPEHTRKLVVQCYMDGCNGWTVIQRNSHDTIMTWSETWTTYQFGFGNLEAEHWLGTEYIRRISEQKWYKVRINLVDAEGNHKYAEYDSFVLRNETNDYMLKLGTYQGNAGDSLSSSQTKNMHDNMKFSCKDRDNDRSTFQNCADVHGGCWWYDSCFDAQLNRKGGIHWSTLCDENCRKSEILLKPIHMYCNRV